MSPASLGAESDWVSRLEACGALTRGHFKLSSGRHSDAYVQCARLLEEPARARQAGEALAAELRRALGSAPQSVLSPALGALLIGHETAAALGVPFRFVERDGETRRFALRRGFHLAAGERVVVVEDAVTTGGSTREVMDLARDAGAEVMAVGAVVDRSGGSPFDVPFVALAALTLPTWLANECPLCAEGSAAVKPGSRPG